MSLLDLSRIWKLYYGNNEISVLYNGNSKIWEKPINDRLVLYTDSSYSGLSGFSKNESVGRAKPYYTTANTWSITEIGTTSDTLIVKYENGGVPSQIPGINYITVTVDAYRDESNNLVDIILEWSGNTDIGYTGTATGIHTAIDSTNSIPQIVTGLLGILPDYAGPFPCIGHVEFSGNGKIGEEQDANLSVYFNENTTLFKWFVDGIEVANNVSTYTPTEAHDGGELDCSLTITNTNGSDTHYSISPITITYNAPVANGVVPDQIWDEDVANSINFAEYITVAGDADLSGVTFSVNTGDIPGMTINSDSGLFSGIPTSPQSSSSLVIDAENSGGIFQISANVEIQTSNAMSSHIITVGDYGATYFGYSTNNVYPANFGSMNNTTFEGETIEMLAVQSSGRMRLEFVGGQVTGISTIYAHVTDWGANNPIELIYYGASGRYESGLISGLGTFFSSRNGSTIDVGLFS